MCGTSISGFGADTQNARLTPAVCGAVVWLAAIVALVVASLQLGAPPAFAYDPPGVAGVRPAPRAVPAPRITPRPRAEFPSRVSPGPKIGANPALGRPAVRGANCSSSCGSQCQMISCSGLSATQCTRARQQCRVSCRTRC
jgi:hypothetical protein